MLAEYYQWWMKGSNKEPKEYPLESRIKKALGK
jgi:hypothetical protein